MNKVAFTIAGVLSCACLACAQPTGTIEGRIQNHDTGEYLSNARVRIEDSRLEALTDQFGFYRLGAVPAGDVQLQASHPGLTTQRAEVAVGEGAVLQRDFSLTRLSLSPAQPGRADDTVTLDDFVVTASREMEGAAVAINTQRHAPNQMNVVTADEFGAIFDGNIGTALKFLPGVDAVYDGAENPSQITLSGAPSGNVPVTIGGFRLASTDSNDTLGGGIIRAANITQASLSSFSRIEVIKSPTPETPGDALAGLINLVPKSAFEYSRPRYEVSAFLSAKEDKLTLARTPDHQIGRSRQIFPGVTLSAIVPVNNRFGFTASAGHSVTGNSSDTNRMVWASGYNRLTSSYLGDYSLQQAVFAKNAQTYRRESLAVSADYRISKRDVVSVGMTANYNEYKLGLRRVVYTLGSGTAPTLVNWQRSGGTVSENAVNAAGVPLGSVANATDLRNKSEHANQYTLMYRHSGPIWKGDLGIGIGTSRFEYNDLDKGFFFSANASIANAAIQFADITPWKVGSITATKNGVPISAFRLDSFVPPNTTTNLPVVRSKVERNRSTNRTIQTNIERSFSTKFLTKAKAGAQVEEVTYDRELPGNGGWAYSGPLTITEFRNPDFTDSMVLGIGTPDGLNMFALAEYFRANPNLFRQNNPAGDYNTEIQNSKFLKETVLAGYVRFDQHFMDRRLWLVSGIRFERTEDEGFGQLQDPTLNYRRNSAGQFINASGTPIQIGGSGAANTPAPIETDPLLIAQRTRIRRGSHAVKSYENFFPSVNASYSFTSNVIARLSYSQTIGRPDVRHLVPGAVLADLSRLPSQTRTTINNTQLEPWRSRNYNAAIEYYFDRFGDVSLRVYRRFINDAFGGQIVPEGQKQGYFDLYSIDAELYGAYDISTSVNISDPLRSDGAELAFRYRLDDLLPAYARGIQVYMNASRHRIAGSEAAIKLVRDQFLFVQPYSVKWGVAVSRPRFSVRMNWSWNSRKRMEFRDSASDNFVEPGTFEYLEPITRVDLDASVVLRRNLSVFVTGRNINHPFVIRSRFGPNTPDYAKGLVRTFIQPVWSAGVRATF